MHGIMLNMFRNAAPLIVCCLAGVLAGGCEPGGKGITLESDTAARMRFRNPKDRANWLTPAQADEMIRNTPNLQLLFVGPAEDYRQGHLPKSMLIPVTGLRAALETPAADAPYREVNKGRLPDKDRPLLVYCWWNQCVCPSVPTYSDLARQILREKGFTNVYSIEGGMRAWLADKRPVDRGMEERKQQ